MAGSSERLGDTLGTRVPFGSVSLVEEVRCMRDGMEGSGVDRTVDGMLGTVKR